MFSTFGLDNDLHSILLLDTDVGWIVKEPKKWLKKVQYYFYV